MKDAHSGMNTWLNETLAALDNLTRAPDEASLARMASVLSELTGRFDSLPAAEQSALQPHLATLLARVTLATENIKTQQSEVADELTKLRNRARVMNAYTPPR